MPVSRVGMSFRRARARSVAGALTGGAPTTSRGFRIRSREVLLIDAVTQEGACQVRSRTQSPCPHRAVVDIRGIPFCEACAREQEAYFAIGELTQEEETWDLRGEPLSKSLGETLGEMLDKMRRPRTDNVAAASRLDLPK